MDTASSTIPTSLDIFRQMLAEHLQPLLFGACLSGPERQAKGAVPIVSYHTRHRLRIAAPSDDRQVFTLQRMLAFREEEREFVERTVLHMHALFDDASTDSDLASLAIERAIAHAVSPESADMVFEVLQIYKRWAEEQNGTMHTTGIYFGKHKGPGGNFFAQGNEEYIKALGASSDTLMAIGRDGNILAVEKIAPVPTDNRKIQHLATPVTLADIALWASSRRKAAVRLTLHGEILVFKDRRLLFVKRTPYWHTFPHSLGEFESILSEDGPGLRGDVRQAVYLTSLDLSFSGQSACIAVVPDRRALKNNVKTLRPDCFLTAKNPAGSARLLAGIVRRKKFQELPRTIRMELCALDGVLLIDAEGNILSAGEGISDGVACADLKQATARAFARGGLGVTVSESGRVEIFGARYCSQQSQI